MRQNLQIAVDFAKRIPKKGVLQITLFGSVARGEDKSDSDIDIAIIHNLKKLDNLQTAVNKIAHDKIQVAYKHIDSLSKEYELVSAITGDGLLLFGRPIKIKFNKKELSPYILIVYDTTESDKKKRMLLNRALHGSVSKSKYRGKTYKTETTGIISQPGIEKLTKACILSTPKKAALVTEALNGFKVPYKQQLIWK